MRAGTLKGHAIDRPQFEKALKLYYGMMGWDADGRADRRPSWKSWALAGSGSGWRKAAPPYRRTEMHVKVKLYGTLRRFSLKETPGVWQGEIPSGTRVRDLIASLGSSEAEVAAAALDNEPCALDDFIPDGAVVMLVTPVGGG